MIRENPDKEKVKEVRKALKENDGYCPCKLIKDETTKCMCKEFREQSYGLCHCELYEKI
jgi:ferredoxin-thioredoxin reductase catalytic subunit